MFIIKLFLHISEFFMVTSIQIQFIGRAYTNEIIVSGTTK